MSYQAEQIGGNPVRSSNVTGGSPSSNLRQISSNQNQDEQMQTATDSNVTFSNLSTVGNMTQRNSSSASVQNRSANSERARESITDDEELPLENPLQRESSSEGVNYITALGMNILSLKQIPICLNYDY